MVNLLINLGIIVGVILVFNIIIFVHELGHYWAAKWRGLKIERFQIWFGKPIWSKTIGGVQWGLGSIPAGGFVALPQMAPMEAIEGSNSSDEPLPPISATDKIIVAFAGPLFSMLLALLVAFGVWQVGKPANVLTSTTVGYVLPGKPAAEAGLKPGDNIIAVNGNPVDCFGGRIDTGIRENVMLSEGDTIRITVERPGEENPIDLRMGFKIPDTRFWERKATRQIGYRPAEKSIVGLVLENSPAQVAGVKVGDVVVSMNGEKLWSSSQLVALAETAELIRLEVLRGDETLELSLVPIKPTQPSKAKPELGIRWSPDLDFYNGEIVYPTPMESISDSMGMMKRTLQAVTSSKSDIGVQHLAGPIGIGKSYFEMFKSQEGWRLALWFTVIFNVNLAVLNMMPFPVLDGGHITLAILEKIAGKPVNIKVLEVIQMSFVAVLFSLFIYVTSKDIGSFIPGQKAEKQLPVKFADPAASAQPAAVSE
ncbi:RIP metalloprotease RseP [Persicirhabdus sediminis]|uniref:Zinc metalloprotease n=1 Tax=Persicirhabdus sediminis TaxID=454144 RepID=A0A8J7MGH8_9BACT|nr:RIP metalloprotease RseP [Persicirhabdus sediminis]MBK1792442.1 RIP metalloprotease RseP [Persicirhabdus sediminis]